MKPVCFQLVIRQKKQQNSSPHNDTHNDMAIVHDKQLFIKLIKCMGGQPKLA